MKIICIQPNQKNDSIQTIGTYDININDANIYIKPDTALLPYDRNQFYIPDFSPNMYCEINMVVKINKMGKSVAERFAYRYYDEVSLGINFVVENTNTNQRIIRPESLTRYFDNSSVTGIFIDKDSLFDITKNNTISLIKNSESFQTEGAHKFICTIDEIIAHITRFITIKTGDLIFVKQITRADRVSIGDHLQGYLGEAKLLDLHIC